MIIYLKKWQKRPRIVLFLCQLSEFETRFPYFVVQAPWVYSFCREVSGVRGASSLTLGWGFSDGRGGEISAERIGIRSLVDGFEGAGIELQ